MTVGQVLRDWATHGVGAAPFVGSAEEVADHLCSLADEADLDGILLHPQVQPSSTIDFVELVLPILRDRGVAARRRRGRRRFDNASSLKPRRRCPRTIQAPHTAQGGPDRNDRRLIPGVSRTRRIVIIPVVRGRPRAAVRCSPVAGRHP